ncbi:MAG: 50S ribosomal protein L4 [Patescibacteria group bacterium]|nr:50S ribosomal protein L4 [Patescibacteria group bacterium]MDD5490192.1 50S ribosomal protein L4 [Patescibacteria group bacterium]
MAKIKVYNLEGKEVGEENLNPDIFDVEIKNSLVHQAVEAFFANKRVAIAHTKDRSEVRGGGKKPWRQKGTGRARHGSTRSPIWIGGGITFGPRKNRNFSQKINKKAKRKALFMGLSDKAKENGIILVNELKLESIKTKKMSEIIKKLPLGKKVVVVIPASDEKIVKSVRNLKNTKVVRADNLNIIDVINSNSLLMPVAAVKKIEETYLKK